MTKSRSTPTWADSPAAVVGRRNMDVTLPSGLKVTVRAVTLDELAVAEALPGDLLAAAVYDSADLLFPQILQNIRDGNVEEAQKLSRDTVLLRDRVVAAALVAPEPSVKVLAALDGFDKEMIAELAQRKRATDATGKVVAAQSLADFDGFRGEPDRSPDSKESGARQEMADIVA